MALQVGQIYNGKYRVLRLLGEGFAGAVYEGEDVERRCRVALETLSAALVMYPEALRRFEIEAKALRKLDAEHVAKVLDVAELSDGSRFLIREYLEGVTLEQRVRERGRLSADDTSRIGIEIAEGLAAAHAVGVVHRGLGPASAFLHRVRADRECVKLLAFGLFLPNDDYECGPSHYAAPEQIKGNVEVDARADVYAAGVVLYECLSGQVPFPTTSPDDLVFQIVMRDPTPLEKIAPDVDLELSTIVHKAMARDVRVRYQSARELAQALSTFRTRRAYDAAKEPKNYALLEDPSAAMSAPDDDDDDEDRDLGDHGTVVMNRKPPFIPTNLTPRRAAPPAPPAPQSIPLPPTPVLTNQGGPVSSRLPVLPASITGLPAAGTGVPGTGLPGTGLPASSAKPAAELVPIVAGVAFGVVFILGALIMLAVRLARGPADEDPSVTPAASASAAPATTAPPPALPSTAEGTPTEIVAPASTSTASPKTTQPRSSPGPRTPSGKRRITDDL